MKKIMMLMAAMLLTACSKDSEVMAEPVNASTTEAGKTLVVYYSYTNNYRPLSSSRGVHTLSAVSGSLRLLPAAYTLEMVKK